MTRRLVALVAVAVLTVTPALGVAPPPRSEVFRVGAAAVDTTPGGPVCLGGYGLFCERLSTGVRDPLFTRALVVSRGEDSVILLTTTAVGLFASYKEEYGRNGATDIREEVSARTGVPVPHVVLQSDHSHAAPDTIGIWGGVEESYLAEIRDAAVQAATTAFRQRRPARLSVAAVEGPPLGSLYSVEPNLRTDDTFRVLAADAVGRRGGRIATFVNYSPHATVLRAGNTELSGDWTGWAAQELEAALGGVGLATVGTLGRTDFGSPGSDDDVREEAARVRLRDLIARAEDALEPVTGARVSGASVFVREPVTNPVFFANYGPGLPDGDRGAHIDRSTSPPFLTGTVLGTYAGALRIGDLFFATAPGEAFPQSQFTLRDEAGVVGPQEHFYLGASNDFLGYMGPVDSYAQIAREGALYLAGCPEDRVLGGLGVPVDEDSCPDHFILQPSPTIGTHVTCSIQDAAERIGFAVEARDDRCGLLTAADDVAAP